jgi:hypothetical protein
MIPRSNLNQKSLNFLFWTRWKRCYEKEALFPWFFEVETYNFHGKVRSMSTLGGNILVWNFRTQEKIGTPWFCTKWMWRLGHSYVYSLIMLNYYPDFNAIVLNLLVVDFSQFRSTDVRVRPNFIVDCSPAPRRMVSPHKFQPNLIIAPFWG